MGRVPLTFQERQFPRSFDPSPWPSRPGEFHPEPLTDPDVNLSIHAARAIAMKTAAFH
jgi:hypothetical protein